MLQIIKELTEKIINEKLFLQKLVSVKFLTLMNPLVNSNLVLDLDISIIDDGLVKVKNTTIFNEIQALKMSGVYKIIA
jgi:3-hydroxyacyl-[acyl-carrier-protein] dehydratase